MSLNQHGDDFIQTSGRHGSNISSQRIDELDKEALRFVLCTSNPPVCVDLGCGDAYQSVRFSLLLAATYAYDLEVPHQAVSSISGLALGHLFHFNQGDLLAAPDDAFPESIDCLYSQRFIHYLKFEDALRLLTKITRKMVLNGKVFLSASGLPSELSEGYSGRNVAVTKRYSPLSAEMSEKHGIKADVCLYDESDMALLLSRSGLEAVRVWRSDFGNIKCIGVKK